MSSGHRAPAAHPHARKALPGCFSTRYPAVEIDVRLTNRHVDLVAKGVDAALRISVARLPDSSLVAQRLSALEMQVFAAPTYLARAGSRGRRRTRRLMRGQKLPPGFPALTVKPCLVGDDVLFVCHACSAGAGLAVLPTFLAREELAAGRLVRVLPRFSQRSGALYLVHPPARHVARKVTAFRDYLVEHFASYPLVGRAG